MPFRNFSRRASAFWLVLVLMSVALRADIPVGTELIFNPDFSVAKKDPAWPDEWKRGSFLTWEKEREAHYLRVTAKEPGKKDGLGREIHFPADAKIAALKVTVRYRTSNLKIGTAKDAAARASVKFRDAVKIEFTPTPAPIILSVLAGKWTEATATVPVPTEATSVTVDFGLYGVESGTLDVSEVSMKSAEPLPDAKTPPDGRDIPIHREGQHTIIGEGKPTIWFIDPYVDVLGHNFDLGITNLVRQAKEKGVVIAVGVARSLDDVTRKNEENNIYVFTYKNINFPLPENAQRLVFINTWLRPTVTWPAVRAKKKDVVLIGSKMLHNNGDGLATDKDRWLQIAKDDPALSYTELDGAGYYLPISVWRLALLKIILEDHAKA